MDSQLVVFAGFEGPVWSGFIAINKTLTGDETCEWWDTVTDEVIRHGKNGQIQMRRSLTSPNYIHLNKKQEHLY